MNASSAVACPVCEGRLSQRLFTKQHKDFLRCAACGLTRVDPLPSPHGLSAYYDREYAVESGMGAALAAAEEMARATARLRLDKVRRYTRGTRWLDVGCGTGVFLDEVVRAGCQGEGIEISTTAAEHAASRNLKIHVGTVEDFVPTDLYDVVTAFDVIEHVLDPRGFLRRVHGLLRPDGVLSLTTPDTNSVFSRLMGRRWYFYIPDQHLFHFNRPNLAQLVTRAGFQVLRVSRARKALTFDYSLIQFRAYNPLIYRVAHALAATAPARWRRRPYGLYIGEMMMIARRAPACV